MGGCFCSLNQTRLACECTFVKIVRNSVAEIECRPKKSLRRKFKGLFGEIK